MKNGTIIATMLGVGAIILIALKWNWIKQKIAGDATDNRPVSSTTAWNGKDDKITTKDCVQANFWEYKIDLELLRGVRRYATTQAPITTEKALDLVVSIVQKVEKVFGGDSVELDRIGFKTVILRVRGSKAVQSSLDAGLFSNNIHYEMTCS
jgi:hypothetical protein